MKTVNPWRIFSNNKPRAVSATVATVCHDDDSLTALSDEKKQEPVATPVPVPFVVAPDPKPESFTPIVAEVQQEEVKRRVRPKSKRGV